MILSPREQSSPEAVELLERLKQQQEGGEPGTAGGGGSSRGGKARRANTRRNPPRGAQPPFFMPPRFPFPPFGLPPYPISGATGRPLGAPAGYPFPPWIPPMPFGALIRPPLPNMEGGDSGGEHSVADCHQIPSQPADLSHPQSLRGKAVKGRAAWPPPPHYFPPTWGAGAPGYLPPFPYSSSAYPPPAAAAGLAHPSYSVPTARGKEAGKRPPGLSSLKFSQSERQAPPSGPKGGSSGAARGGELRQQMPYDDHTPLPSPFSQQQELVLKSMGSFPGFEGEDPPEGISAAPQVAPEMVKDGALGDPGAGAPHPSSVLLSPPSGQQGGTSGGALRGTQQAAGATGAGGVAGSKVSPNTAAAVPASSLQLGISSRLSIPMQQLLKLLQQVGGDAAYAEASSTPFPGPYFAPPKILLLLKFIFSIH